MIGSDYMKIEKLSDNQIRCTLKKSDLTSRHLKISELAYGSDKAKELFRDIMKQAAYEFGFEADDIPLMIEAIPVSSECIVLIVTKVDDPEELDTRFSRFSPSDSEDDDVDYPYGPDDFGTLSTIDDMYDEDDDDDDLPETVSEELDSSSDSVSENVLSLFNRLKDCLNNELNANIGEAEYDTSGGIDVYDSSKHSLNAQKLKASMQAPKPVIRIFSFTDFDTFVRGANAAIQVFNDRNSLYKDSKDSTYYLVIEKTVCNVVDFNKVCNILSEFGTKENATQSRVNFFKEHLECIIPNRAIQVACRIN